MTAPLDGLLVLDFSTLLPGPMATLMLAEAGAEVIKIERPGGEEMRRYQPRWGGGERQFRDAEPRKESRWSSISSSNPARRAFVRCSNGRISWSSSSALA